MYDRLPDALVSAIYKYDATYHEIHRKQVMPQLNRFFEINARMIKAFFLDTETDTMTDRQFARRIKTVVRFSKKADLKCVYRWFGGRVPKHTTKTRLVLMLYVKLCDSYMSVLADVDDEIHD